MSTKLLKKFLLQQSESSTTSNKSAEDKSLRELQKKRQLSFGSDAITKRRRKAIDSSNSEQNVQKEAKGNEQRAALQQKINAVLTLDTTINAQGSRASNLLLEECREETKKIQKLRKRLRDQDLDGIGYGNCRGNSSMIVKKYKPNHKMTLTKHTKAIIEKKEEARQMKELIRRVQKDAIQKHQRKNTKLRR